MKFSSKVQKQEYGFTTFVRILLVVQIIWFIIWQIFKQLQSSHGNAVFAGALEGLVYYGLLIFTLTMLAIYAFKTNILKIAKQNQKNVTRFDREVLVLIIINLFIYFAFEFGRSSWSIGF